MTSKITVLIADDHEFVCRGLSDILSELSEVQVVGSCRVSADIPRMVNLHQPLVLLLDMVWHSDQDMGIRVMKLVREISPNTRIIAMSNYPIALANAKKHGSDIVQ